MDASSSVATMQGTFFLEQAVSMFFCSLGSISKGRCTPRSPLARMIPSASVKISFRCSTPCSFSIFARSRSFSVPAGRDSRRTATSFRLCVKGSISPHTGLPGSIAMVSRSSRLRGGSISSFPSRQRFLPPSNCRPDSTRQTRAAGLFSSTSRRTFPSSAKSISPG